MHFDFRIFPEHPHPQGHVGWNPKSTDMLGTMSTQVFSQEEGAGENWLFFDVKNFSAKCF